MYFGIKVYYLDGDYEWIDPCIELPEVTDNKATIENMYSSWDLTNVDYLERYELCQECLHDLEGWSGCEACERGE